MKKTSVKAYLDTRRVQDSKIPAPLYINIIKDSKTAMLKMEINIQPCNWDANVGMMVKGAMKNAINQRIIERMQEIQLVIDDLHKKKLLRNMTAKEIKEFIMQQDEKDEDKKNFTDAFADYMKRLSGSTLEKYETTWKRITEYDKQHKYLDYARVNFVWLSKFEEFLAKKGNRVNTIAIHMRNIRAVFNYALDYEYTTLYPFRKFKVKHEATPNLALSLEQIREIMTMEVKEEWMRVYVDMFRLSFLLIGINTKDLLHLTEIKDGRVNYQRAKTGKFLSVKVEPEALAIIDRYRGKKLLLNVGERYQRYTTFTQKANDHLKKIVPGMTTYWARYTWAAMAQQLEIPKETISAAFSHTDRSGSETTNIYLPAYDLRKTDEANRRVIDYVLGK